MMERLVSFYVYLLASRKHGTLYLGVTNNLPRRVWEHRNKLLPGFSARYDVTRLVYLRNMSIRPQPSRGGIGRSV